VIGFVNEKELSQKRKCSRLHIPIEAAQNTSTQETRAHVVQKIQAQENIMKFTEKTDSKSKRAPMM
jgi:hypothetical protein